MRIKKTDRRERLWSDLKGALDENTTSGALDEAARFTVRMVEGGGTGTGQLEELLAAADERGALTGAEIVEILDTREVPLEWSSSYSVGE